jgi:hypothetical protein
MAFSNPTAQAILDFSVDALQMFVVICAFLWLRANYFIIALVFYTIEFNVDLFLNPLLHLESELLQNPSAKWFGTGLDVSGLIFFFMGLAGRPKVKFLSDKSTLNLIPTLSIVLVLTVTVQIIFRLL